MMTREFLFPIKWVYLIEQLSESISESFEILYKLVYDRNCLSAAYASKGDMDARATKAN